LVNFQEEFVADSQDDERLHTFVVHVPTLGAEEKNVPAAMQLLDGPRVTHYWNGDGDLGSDFSEALDIEVYAWDVWMLYPPNVTWEGEIPPSPAYWQHKIGVDKGEPADPAAFLTQTTPLLDKIAP